MKTIVAVIPNLKGRMRPLSHELNDDPDPEADSAILDFIALAVALGATTFHVEESAL